MRLIREIKEAELVPVTTFAKESLGVESIKVKLPSTVQAALLDAKLIDDPYFGENYKKIQWINEQAWEYEIPIKRSKKISKIIFHGVDYRYSVLYGDKLLLKHEGMFSPTILDLSQLPESFTLRLYVEPNLPGERPYIIPPFVGLKKNMRFSMSYGWDFAPRIITQGIWDSVELIETDGVFIRDLKARGLSDGSLDISFNVEGDDGEYDININVVDNESIIFSDKERITVKDNIGRFSKRVKVPNVDPWWPWDQGEPKLYRLEISVSREGQVLDNIQENIGFISIKKKRTAFYVNGRKVFLRGVNWVPADSLLRLDESRYKRLLKAVKEANVNIVRIWGGGIRERRFFYNLTDALGIMVWQEFPFACEEIEISDRMINLVKKETSGIVIYLRNHPSIVLWSGGNELAYPKVKPILDVLEDVVGTYNPEVPFQPVSPFNGDKHSWYVWHGFMPLYAYRFDIATLVSEFGLQAVPSIKTLESFLPKNAIWPPNHLWVEHKAELNKHYFYAVAGEAMRILLRTFMFIETALFSLFGGHENITDRLLLRYSSKVRELGLRRFIIRSQFAQTLGLKIGIEHFRVNKNKFDGSLVWQFNDPWPNISWSIFDYYERKKLAYHFVRMSYEPLQAMLVKQGRKVSLFIVNDLPYVVRGKVRVLKDGAVVFNGNFEIEPSSVKRLATFKFKLGWYETRILQNNRVIRNIYPPQFFVEPPRLIVYLINMLIKLFIRGSEAVYQTPS